MTPRHIGPYAIERELGTGGMGMVYLGRHEETGELAAVKVLPTSGAQNAGSVARFEREIAALGKLTNPHVVKFFDSGEDHNTFYYAMEYVDGETIAQRLMREKRLPWREVIEIALQICSALKAAHDAGIIHRDLKPSNLLVTNDGTLKLTDFGVAQVFASSKLTVTGGVVGTVEYMSPEQAQGKRVTRQSDLYSLGAVMYAMLTGRPPFTGKTSLDILQKHRFGRFDRPQMYVPEISHWLDDLVCQLLEKEPEKRPPDAFVLSRRLREIQKKIELSEESRTVAAEDFDGSAPTAIINADLSVQESAGVAGGGPGAGTLMRDLLRAEIENQHKPSTVSAWLNNTWVLMALLALLIAGGWYFYQNRNSPQSRFEAGVALLEESEGEEWRQARDKFFQPLLKEDPDRWQDKVQPYLDRIALLELEDELDAATRRSRKPNHPDDARRFLLLARHYQTLGDTGRAERTLSALAHLLEGDPERQQLLALVERNLEEIRKQRQAGDQRHALLQSALERAEEHRQNNRPAEARAIWQSIVELYGEDPDVQEEVQRVQQLLNKR